MADPYIGEIRMFGGTFAPVDWLFCNGQLVSIADYSTLFQLIGTTYGGDGVNTFALPNLQGRVPIDQGSGNVLGGIAGTETVTLTSSQIPSHGHAFIASTDPASTTSPSGALLAAGNSIYVATTSVPPQILNAGSIAAAGGNQPHDNMMPFLAVSFIIAMFGVYPTQN